MTADFRMPTFPKIPPNPLLQLASKERLNPAKWMYERLVKQIIAFEEKLTPEQEIGGRFISAPREGTIHIEDVGYWGPDMLIFYCKDTDGREMELLQHYSQFSVLLCAVPKEAETARRIGFVLESKLKAEASP